MSYIYTVILEPAEEGGFIARVPALPGCMTQGETLDEVSINIEEAIEGYIECLKEDGKIIPNDVSPIIKVVSLNIDLDKTNIHA